MINGLPREHIEGPLRGFLKGNPRPHPRPDPSPKTFGGRPLGFLALGSDLDAASGLPSETPRGAFNMLPRESIEYFR